MSDVLKKIFEVPRNKITEYIQDILFFSEIVFTKGDLNIVDEDPDDNYILETAIEGKADSIIGLKIHTVHTRNTYYCVNTINTYGKYNCECR